MSPIVSIIMGSTSDLPVMEKAAQLLNDLHVPFEMNALSAHRTPEAVEEFAKNARQRGIKVIIAAAGMAGKEAQTVANLLVNEMIAYLKGAGVSLTESGIAPAQVAALAKLLATDAISSNQAHEVFEAMAQTGDDPNKIVDERGMRQVSDAGALQPIVDEVLANCVDQAQQYRDGNQKVIGFLVGQCMKASRGKGNPKLFNELLRTSLS